MSQSQRCFRLRIGGQIFGDLRSGKPPARHQASCARRRLPSGRTSMMSYPSAPRSLLLAGAFFGAFTLQSARSSPPRPPAAGAAPAAAHAASAGLAPDRAAGQRGRGQACAGRAAADSRRRRQAADRQAQGAGRLQHRGLCRRHGERAIAGAGRQGHGVRRQPPRRQGLCHRQQGRQARGEGRSPPACTGRTASPSRTARSTSPSSRRSPRSRRSRTISTVRRSRR